MPSKLFHWKWVGKWAAWAVTATDDCNDFLGKRSTASVPEDDQDFLVLAFPSTVTATIVATSSLFLLNCGAQQFAVGAYCLLVEQSDPVSGYL